MSIEPWLKVKRRDVLRLLDQIERAKRKNAQLRDQVKQMRSVINEMADRSGRPEYRTSLFDDFMNMMRHRHAVSARKEGKL